MIEKLLADVREVIRLEFARHDYDCLAPWEDAAAKAAIAATFAFIREQAWKEEVVEAQQAVFGPDSHIRPPARLMVSLMNKAMLDQIERTQNDE
jgi:hypothetical protein